MPSIPPDSDAGGRGGPRVRAGAGRPAGDHAERDRAQELGCRWFTGPFHETPKLLPGRKVPTGKLRRIASIVRLRPESASLEQVVEVIEQDLGLSVKLLRYLNSAYFGLAARVARSTMPPFGSAPGMSPAGR